MNLPAVIFLFIKQIKAEAKIINQRTEHATPAAIFVGKKIVCSPTVNLRVYNHFTYFRIRPTL
jgi:hypothetical protein